MTTGTHKPMSMADARAKQDRYKWLQFCKDAQGAAVKDGNGRLLAWCMACMTAAVVGNWANPEAGAVLRDESTLKDHANSQKHKAAVARAGTLNIHPIIKAQQGKAKLSAHNWVPQVLKLVVFCALHFLPASLFPQLLLLFKLVAGLDLTGGYKLSHNRYYWALLRSMGEHIIALQVASLCRSPVWGLLLDESADIANKENVSIFVSYVQG